MVSYHRYNYPSPLIGDEDCGNENVYTLQARLPFDIYKRIKTNYTRDETL